MQKIKQEKGLSPIGIIIIILIIIAITVFSVINLKNKVNDELEQEIKSNMLLIQGATKVTKQTSIVQKSDDILVGTKLNQVVDNEIIDNFINLNLIGEDQLESYYMLTDEDLTKLNLNIKNEEGAYYIVNYDDNDVLITKEIGGKHRISEMDKEETTQNETTEETQDTENKEQNSEDQNNKEQNNEEQSNENQNNE